MRKTKVFSIQKDALRINFVFNRICRNRFFLQNKMLIKKTERDEMIHLHRNRTNDEFFFCIREERVPHSK